MNQNKKRILVFAFASVLTLGSSIPAFANTNDSIVSKTTTSDTFRLNNCDITFLENSDEQCVVKVDYGNYYEIATRKIATEDVTVQTFDSDGNLIKSENYNFSNYNNNDIEVNAAGDYQHTLSNYEYDIEAVSAGRHESWKCTREKDIKNRTYYVNTTTAERLERWRDYVEDINDLEIDLAYTITETVAAMAIEAYFTAGTASALTYLEGSAEALLIMRDLINTWDDADIVFDKL